jgi:phage baseplate assembly protein W
MPRQYLGVGWAFPIQEKTEGKKGEIQLAEHEESVRQSIQIILGTAKGERVMRPDFGCGINDMVFELNSPSTAGRIAEEVRDALLMQEPRIDVRDVLVQSQSNGEVLLISIDYEVRATNNAFNLVYPFYLESNSR